MGGNSVETVSSMESSTRVKNQIPPTIVFLCIFPAKHVLYFKHMIKPFDVYGNIRVLQVLLLDHGFCFPFLSYQGPPFPPPARSSVCSRSPFSLYQDPPMSFSPCQGFCVSRHFPFTPCQGHPFSFPCQGLLSFSISLFPPYWAPPFPSPPGVLCAPCSPFSLCQSLPFSLPMPSPPHYFLFILSQTDRGMP